MSAEAAVSKFRAMARTSRILVIDDNRAIHDDFRKILASPRQATVDLSALEAELFGEGDYAAPPEAPEIVSAYQGSEAVELVLGAAERGTPFAAAFVDFRMPPGWDGVETIQKLWSVAPDLQVAMCTAFADYSPEEITQRLGQPERLVILRKPFDPVEVQELARAMVAYWQTRYDRARSAE
jgi:CheY-like chemotaxis protein